MKYAYAWEFKDCYIYKLNPEGKGQVFSGNRAVRVDKRTGNVSIVDYDDFNPRTGKLIKINIGR